MKKYALWAVYGVIFLVFLFKMFYYREELYYVPDEDAHISYLAYVQENPGEWLPKSENIKLCEDRLELEEGFWRYTIGDNTCYLQKPTFYYKVMQLVGGVITEETSDGRYVYLNLERLKTANIYLTALVMILILYISYTRLGRLTQSVLCHGLCALAVTSVGQFAKYGACIMNDNLTNLGAVLLILGVLRYIEKKRSWATHLLAAAGIILSVLSGLSLRGYLPFIALAVIAGAQWLISCQSYRLWHFLGYKAKARRLQRERAEKTIKPELPAVLPCVLAVLMLLGGVGFEALAAGENSVYSSIYDANLERQMKKQGYMVLHADTAEKMNDTEAVGYLMQGLTVEQDFAVTEEMLDYSELAIAIRIGTYDRKNEIPLYVELFQDSGFGKAYRVNCSRVKNNQYVEIVFPTENMQAENCHVKIYSDATNGNQAVTVYTTKNCVLSPTMKMAGTDTEKNLVMRVFTPYDAEAVK